MTEHCGCYTAGGVLAWHKCAYPDLLAENVRLRRIEALVTEQLAIMDRAEELADENGGDLLLALDARFRAALAQNKDSAQS